jgi:hypothetical protein
MPAFFRILTGFHARLQYYKPNVNTPLGLQNRPFFGDRHHPILAAFTLMNKDLTALQVQDASFAGLPPPFATRLGASA